MTRMRVHGTPEPQARPRWGNGTFYSPKTAWWKACYMQGRMSKPRTPYDCAVRLTVYLQLPKPKSTPARETWHRRRPDIDNIVKAVMDAMTAAGWWKDDGCVAELVARKTYAKNPDGPGADVLVESLED